MLFICEKCGCIDDSARENNFLDVLYGFENYKDSYYNTHFCCTQCCPKQYKDGVYTLSGSWHNYFPKKYYWELSPEQLFNLKDKIYNLNDFIK